MDTKLSSENIKERNYLKDLRVDGKIILKWKVEKHDVKMRTG